MPVFHGVAFAKLFAAIVTFLGQPRLHCVLIRGIFYADEEILAMLFNPRMLKFA